MDTFHSFPLYPKFLSLNIIDKVFSRVAVMKS